jgi:hypothetical protein
LRHPELGEQFGNYLKEFVAGQFRK